MLLLCNQNKKTVVFLFSFEAISSFLRSNEIMKPRKKREGIKELQCVRESQNDIKIR